jgi:cysteine desulfurase
VLDTIDDMSAYPIYLDYNATTPCDPRVVEVMLPFFSQHFGNAASKSHAHGWYAEEAVEYAREQIANLIGADAQEIVFTSGATEAINLAIRGVAEKNAHKGKHIITVATEHKAVLDVCEYLADQGYEITVLPVDKQGIIDLDQLRSSIRKDTLLIAAMYANNETGVIHPIAKIAEIAKEHDVLFFCDATQAVGKKPVKVKHEGIDLMAFTAHKMYGPKGVGVLYVKKQTPKIEIAPLLYGGGHERKLRSGTLNVTGIVGMGKAAEICNTVLDQEPQTLYRLNNLLWEGIKSLEGVSWNGKREQSLSNVSNILFAVPGADRLLKLLTKTISVSSGSACSSAIASPSHVLKAMGLTDEEAYSSIRFSIGRFTTEEEINKTIDAIKLSYSKLNSII